MQQRIKVLSIMVAGGLSLAVASGGVLYAATGGSGGSEPVAQAPRGAQAPLLKQGQWVFRYDTFGDEIKWTDTLHLNQVIQSAVSPATALSVGLKVDVDALPDSVKQGIANGSIDLNNPQTTLALIKLNAVVGIQGTVDTNPDGSMTLARVGTTCASLTARPPGRRRAPPRAPAPCATQPWTIRLRPASGTASMAGPTATSIRAQSLRCRLRSPRPRRPS